MATFDLGRVTPLYKGGYSASTSYELNDVVLYEGNLYWHHKPTATVGVLPTDTTVWGVVFTDEGLRAEIRGYADNAQESADSALSSKTVAAQSASQASASASQAALSAQTAQTAETGATASAQTASTKASEATASAQSAASTAQIATDKATLASQKASEASESASTASEAKTAAITNAQLSVTKADEARSSATQAANSATSAQTSASAASASETAAATSASNAATSEAAAKRYAEDSAAYLGAYPTDTASGAIATFADGADNVPVKSLVVDIDHVQDLHGYEKPWPGGGGKNKFNVDAIVNSETISVSNGEITVVGNGVNSGKTLGELANLTVGETYILTTTTTGTGNYIYLASSGNSWYFGTQRTITETDLSSTVRFYSGAAGTTAKITNFMIRLASVTDATFAPYSNICPITGWTGATVQRAGKNLKNLEFSQVNQKNIITNVFALKAGTYTLSVNYNGTPTWGVYLRNGRTVGSPFIKREYNATTLTFTLDKDYSELCVSMYNENGITASEVTNFQLEHGSTATAYEPYQSITYPITFPSEAGTVYGGSLDVTNGVLTVTKGFIQSYNGEMLPGAWISDMDAYTEGATPTTGAEVCYDLSAPVTYNLTPTEVKSLLGQNNIWADTGNTTVEYRADTSAYITKKIAEAISALS